MMETAPCHLVVGLGNPGERYRETRHNVGFRVIQALASAEGIRLTCGNSEIRWGRGRIAGRLAILAQPLAYMNRSGSPVRKLLEEHRIGRETLLVIHDDIDLALGRFKIKEKGGDGGHRGIRSLIDALGDGCFARLRIGIGRPAADVDIVDYVLGTFDEQASRTLAAIIDRACEAVTTVLADGLGTAMNKFNAREPLL